MISGGGDFQSYVNQMRQLHDEMAKSEPAKSKNASGLRSRPLTKGPESEFQWLSHNITLHATEKGISPERAEKLLDIIGKIKGTLYPIEGPTPLSKRVGEDLRRLQEVLQNALNPQPTHTQPTAQSAPHAVPAALTAGPAAALASPAHPAALASAVPGQVSPQEMARARAVLESAKAEDFQHSPFCQHLHYTSDHTWKTYTYGVRTGNPKKDFGVSVATWNLADRCSPPRVRHQPPEPPVTLPSNNPLNLSESDIEYVARKRAQFQELRALLTGATFGKVVAEAVNAVMLQEVDFLVQGATKNPNPSQLAFAVVYEDFSRMLQEVGYKMIATPRGPGQDPMICVYNPKVMTPKGDHLTGCIAQEGGRGQQFRGAEATFIHRATKREFDLASLHLKYDQNAQVVIEQYQAQKTKEKRPTFGVGDLNQPPNLKAAQKGPALSSAIIDFKYATNVDATDRNDLRTLTTVDTRTGHMKSYDSAVANPGRPDERVLVTEGPQGHFVKNGDGTMRVDFVNINRTHASLAGEPWKRNFHLFDEKVNKLLNPKENRKELYDDLVEVTRNISLRHLPEKLKGLEQAQIDPEVRNRCIEIIKDRIPIARFEEALAEYSRKNEPQILLDATREIATTVEKKRLPLLLKSVEAAKKRVPPALYQECESIIRVKL